VREEEARQESHARLKPRTTRRRERREILAQRGGAEIHPPLAGRRIMDRMDRTKRTKKNHANSPVADKFCQSILLCVSAIGGQVCGEKVGLRREVHPPKEGGQERCATRRREGIRK